LAFSSIIFGDDASSCRAKDALASKARASSGTIFRTRDFINLRVSISSVIGGKLSLRPALELQ